MNQQVKQQWVEALRSGAYTQCQGELRNGSDEYCVNGVLCELHRLAAARSQGWERHGRRFDWYYQGSSTFPAQPVREWAEIDDDTCLDVEHMNDSREEGKTFPELADWIETNL